MTDKRLLCVAAMVRQGARLADIGTDHAHLPVYLLQQGRIVSAIAADIGEGPADSARKTVAAAGLQERVTVRVGDGLTVVRPDEVTDIVIAGMGGETIIHILSQTPWLPREDCRLILQPMTKTVELRDWLYQNGYVIEEEHLVLDGRHIYCVMAVCAGEAAEKTAVLPYVGALSLEEGQPYFQKQLDYLASRERGCRCAGQEEEAARYQRLAQALSDYVTSGGLCE